MRTEEQKKNMNTNTFIKTVSLINERGLQLPQNINLEEVVLGSMIIDNKAIDEIIDLLSEEVFYSQRNKEIFRTIKILFEESLPIDIYTVTEKLKKRGLYEEVGGEMTIISLTNRVSSSANIEYHCRLLQQKAIKRDLIHTSSKIIENCYDETIDIFDLLDESESNLFDITNRYMKKNSDSAEILIREKIKELENMKDSKDGLSGLGTGFVDIDKVTSGWQNSDLVILAARPSMGKTALALSMARNMSVDFKIPVAIFSLEMSAQQLITRFISAEVGISSNKLRIGGLTEDEWALLYNKISAIEDAPLYIDDTPSLSVFDLRAKARRLVSKHGVKVIMIDYLQLMTAGNNVKGAGLREQEISTISRNLKALAKELNIPIIALAQVSRQVEAQGGSKRPLLSHLRESGAIEQDADIVSFLYRPEYYNIKEWDDEEQSSTRHQAEFIIAKHRNGGLASVRLKFIPEFTKFSNLNTFIDDSQLYKNTFSENDSSAITTTKISRRSKNNIKPKEDDDIYDNTQIKNDNDVPF